MRDPDLVKRAERAAISLERAWIRWRAAHGLGTEPVPPVSSYVGYSLVEPWGQPRVVFGVGADEAEKLAALLDGHDCVGPVHAGVSGRPDWRRPAGEGQAAISAADPLGMETRQPVPATASAGQRAPQDQPPKAGADAPSTATAPAASLPALPAPAVPGAGKPGPGASDPETSVPAAAAVGDGSGWLYGPQSARVLSRPGKPPAQRTAAGDADTAVSPAASKPPLSRMFPAVPLLPVACPVMTAR